MEAHLTTELLDAFLEGRCGADESSRVETHIDGCAECRVLLSTLARGTRVDDGLEVTRLAVPPALPFAPGEVIAGKYRVERLLGAGGMGAVAAAWHLRLNQQVALKFMLPALASDAGAVARFQREARAAVRLHTPHACRVFDLDGLEDGTPFLVMELLEGESLEQRLARDGALPEALAIRWAKDILAALGEAHALGIVHRDLKPANLFLVRRPGDVELIKVVDFGIAKSAHPEIEQGLANTSARMLVGSPLYMSPEQTRPGANVDGASDLWSLGVVLYRMLSAQLPFAADNWVNLMMAIQSQPHRPLTELGVSPRLSAIVDRCLEKSAERRFTDASELVAALERLSAAPEPSGVRPAAKARKVSLGAAVTVAAVMAVGGGLLWSHTRPPPSPRPSPSPVVQSPRVPLPDALELEVSPTAAVVEPKVMPTSEPPPRRVPTAEAPRPRRAAPPAMVPSPMDDIFGDRR